MHGTIYLGLLRETEQPDLKRLADLIKLVAALPPSGAVVLVSSPRERAEISDLILQHRGTAVLDPTKVSICADTMSEFAAAGGRLHSRVFLAPGYEPKSGPSFWNGALEFNWQNGWWQRPVSVEQSVTRSVPKPSCWEETAPIAEPAAPPFATVTLAPLADAPANDRGPWHRPEPTSTALEADPFITMRYETGAACPYELRAWIAPAYLTCLLECFASQAAADAALPAFAARVRAAQATPSLAHPTPLREAA